MPTTPAYVYTNAEGVTDLLGAVGLRLRLDDDESGTTSAEETVRLTRSTYFGTEEINLYLAERYPPDQLATSWLVFEWATIFAAVWLCMRRGNPVPLKLGKAEDRIRETLQEIHDGNLALATINARENDQPGFSNIRLDNTYRVRQLRVQPAISDGRRAGYPQALDWFSLYARELEP